MNEMRRLINIMESAEAQATDEGALGKAVGAGALAYMLANNPLADKPKDVDAPSAEPTQVTQPQAQSLEDIADHYMNKYKARGVTGTGPMGSINQSALAGTPEEALYRVMLKMSPNNEAWAEQGMVRYLDAKNPSHPAYVKPYRSKNPGYMPLAVKLGSKLIGKEKPAK